MSVQKKNVHSGTWPSSCTAITHRSADIAAKERSAVCESRRIPSRSTSRELVNEATAMKTAAVEKASGKKAPIP